MKIEMVLACDYCGGNAHLVDSKEVYGRSYGMIYLCRTCNAYVGVHKGTTKPLGRLANVELRKAKISAHTAFDSLWKRKIELAKCSKFQARKAGYKWLAQELGIDGKDCHIGMFDVAMCNRVIEVCKS